MNDQQLESAARHYCQLIGANPDLEVGHGAKPDADGYMPGICLRSPQWMLIAEKLKDHARMNAAIRFGIHGYLE